MKPLLRNKIFSLSYVPIVITGETTFDRFQMGCVFDDPLSDSRNERLSLTLHFDFAYDHLPDRECSEF